MPVLLTDIASRDQTQLKDHVSGQGTSKAAKTRHKLAKLKIREAGIASATDNKLHVHTTDAKASQNELWGHHPSRSKHDISVSCSEARIGSTVRFAWFPLSLLLVFLGAKWGSEMGIVRQIDELHAENQHLKAQESVAHCLEEDSNVGISLSSEILATRADDSNTIENPLRLQATLKEESSDRSLECREDVECGIRMDASDVEKSTMTVLRTVQPMDDRLAVKRPLGREVLQEEAVCRVNTTGKAATGHARDEIGYDVCEACSDCSMPHATQCKSGTFSSMVASFGAGEDCDHIRDEQDHLGFSDMVRWREIGGEPSREVSQTASWQLKWAAAHKSEVAQDVYLESETDQCFDVRAHGTANTFAITPKSWLNPCAYCLSCQTSSLRSSLDAEGGASTNLSWLCNSPECFAVFSSQLQLMHSFEELPRQSQQRTHAHSADYISGTAHWQLSWSTYLQKVVSDAGAEMALLAQNTCGRYAQYLQRVVEDASKALHQDKTAMWRLAWFGSSSSQRYDLPLFPYSESFFGDGDILHPKATWRLVWTQSML